MKLKNFSLFLVDILYFIVMLICWIVIWISAGLTLTTWKGFALFIAVVIIAMLGTIRNALQERIEEKYLNNNERRHK